MLENPKDSSEHNKKYKFIKQKHKWVSLFYLIFDIFCLEDNN